MSTDQHTNPLVLRSGLTVQRITSTMANSGDTQSLAGPESSALNPRRIAAFSGSDQSVRIESWLSLFELVSDGKADRARLILLMQYLSGEAINWFATDICPVIDTLSWNDAKKLMTQRFGTPVVHPIIEAQKQVLSRADTVQTYFDAKMSLLRRAKLPDSAMVAMLTDGMPQQYRPTLIGSQPASTLAWLAIALQLEGSFSRSFSDRHVRPQATSPARARHVAANARSNRRSHLLHVDFVQRPERRIGIGTKTVQRENADLSLARLLPQSPHWQLQFQSNLCSHFSQLQRQPAAI